MVLRVPTNAERGATNAAFIANAENAACASIVEEYANSNSKLMLTAGEMTAQELRTSKAILKFICRKIRDRRSDGN